MKAEEEQCFQSKKTDASLYNGRPTGTGTQCHSVGAASRTPSISKYKDGVSVEHAYTPTKRWFVLRVSYGRVLKAKAVVSGRISRQRIDNSVRRILTLKKRIQR